MTKGPQAQSHRRRVKLPPAQQCLRSGWISTRTRVELQRRAPAEPFQLLLDFGRSFRGLQGFQGRTAVEKARRRLQPPLRLFDIPKRPHGFDGQPAVGLDVHDVLSWRKTTLGWTYFESTVTLVGSNLLPLHANLLHSVQGVKRTQQSRFTAIQGSIKAGGRVCRAEPRPTAAA